MKACILSDSGALPHSALTIRPPSIRSRTSARAAASACSDVPASRSSSNW